MKKEVIIGTCGLLFILMLVVALFRSRNVQDAAGNTLHEIRTADAWKQSAYQPIAYCPTYPQGIQGYSPYQAGVGQQAGAQPAAGLQAAMPGAPPILPGQQSPVLIKQLGAEVIPVGGGKVKFTGIMGGSWADKAGLKAGDILLSFDTKRITGLEQFQTLVSTAPPEKNYKITFLRGARTKQAVVTVGEGEMEGFTPIPQPKLP